MPVASSLARARARANSRAESATHSPRAYYEAARESRFRILHQGGGHPDELVRQGARALRDQARYLERNHDLARGILRTLTNNIVGASGIGVEPQPRREDGSIHDEFAARLRELWRDWCMKPEVTWRMPFSKVQRAMARTWLRDGEAFAQMLSGAVPLLDHGTEVPFSLEIFEPDMLPLDLDDPGRNLRQGIELNAWGRPRNYHFYRTHPQDGLTATRGGYRVVPASRVLHLYDSDRLHQRRGVSEFASVLNRLEDVRDYEESERVAAKLAARLTMYVRRGSPDAYNPDDDPRPIDANGNRMPREIGLEAGTILDNLGAGEEVGIIDTKRPNVNAVAWRQGQLRAVAAGIGASYSSIARDYNGTYSAQRQELVEQWVNYAVLTDEFVGMFVRPVWENFVRAAIASGVIVPPPDLVPNSEDDALFIGQSMPWIDPMREAEAWLSLVQAGFASEPEAIRRRGANPRDVLEQIAAWRRDVAARGLAFSSQMPSPNPAAPAQPKEEPPQ
jgi:lambda family phage portal protein